MGRREQDSPRSSVVGALLGLGAFAAGAAAACVALLKFKAHILAEDESPIIIKSGSLSVAVKDETNGNIRKAGRFYRVHSDAIKDKQTWTVTPAELAAGFPVRLLDPVVDVKNVELETTSDDTGQQVTIRITFAGNDGDKFLKVEAPVDGFGDRVRERRVSKSKKHKLRAVHKAIDGNAFEVVKITVVPRNGEPVVLEPGQDYSLACKFA